MEVRTTKSNTYEEFVDKFKPKLTTDDCYTPPLVYDAVADWVAAEYGVDRSKFVRPFYPGGDYEHFEYPADCIVVDNPPFSILSNILNFYTGNGVKFFLFAPTLTLFSASASAAALGVGSAVTYENGAKVNTSFVTSLEKCRFRSAPTLYKAVKEADEATQSEKKKKQEKYSYPIELVTATALAHYSKYGVEFAVDKEESFRVRAIDSQRPFKKTIFGSGYLISERAAAERAAAHVWTLSEREKNIVVGLGCPPHTDAKTEEDGENP